MLPGIGSVILAPEMRSRRRGALSMSAGKHEVYEAHASLGNVCRFWPARMTQGRACPLTTGSTQCGE